MMIINTNNNVQTSQQKQNNNSTNSEESSSQILQQQNIIHQNSNDSSMKSDSQQDFLLQAAQSQPQFQQQQQQIQIDLGPQTSNPTTMLVDSSRLIQKLFPLLERYRQFLNKFVFCCNCRSNLNYHSEYNELEREYKLFIADNFINPQQFQQQVPSNSQQIYNHQSDQSQMIQLDSTANEIQIPNLQQQHASYIEVVHPLSDGSGSIVNSTQQQIISINDLITFKSPQKASTSTELTPTITKALSFPIKLNNSNQSTTGTTIRSSVADSSQQSLPISTILNQNHLSQQHLFIKTNNLQASPQQQQHVSIGSNQFKQTSGSELSSNQTTIDLQDYLQQRPMLVKLINNDGTSVIATGIESAAKQTSISDSHSTNDSTLIVNNNSSNGNTITSVAETSNQHLSTTSIMQTVIQNNPQIIQHLQQQQQITNGTYVTPATVVRIPTEDGQNKRKARLSSGGDNHENSSNGLTTIVLNHQSKLVQQQQQALEQQDAVPVVVHIPPSAIIRSTSATSTITSGSNSSGTANSSQYYSQNEDSFSTTPKSVSNKKSKNTKSIIKIASRGRPKGTSGTTVNKVYHEILNSTFFRTEMNEREQIYYRCESDGCLFGTSNQTDMIIHLRHVHAVMRPFGCTVPGCKAAFKQKYKLKVHSVVHTKERPFVCEWPGCNGRFSQSGHLSRHKKRHMYEEKYECSWEGCNRTFIQKHSLKYHLMSHRGEKPWKCPVDGCKKAFIERWKLLKHEQLHLSSKNQNNNGEQSDLKTE